MDLAAFRTSLEGTEPPPGVGVHLAALWWDAKGYWHRAHGCVDGATGRDAAWVHAYLHRKEGDLSNARYWYAQANQVVAKGPLAEEWTAIAATLLAAQS